MIRADEQPPLPVLDVRTYKLEPGAGEEFDRLVREDALPMLHRFGIDVVGSGPSLDDRDLYCLLRAFPSAARRDGQLGSFYSSDEWRQNYGDTALALVDAYHIAVLPFAPLLANGERSDLKTP